MLEAMSISNGMAKQNAQIREYNTNQQNLVQLQNQQREKKSTQKTFHDYLALWGTKTAEYRNTASIVNMSRGFAKENKLEFNDKYAEVTTNNITDIKLEVTGSLSNCLQWVRKLESSVDHFKPKSAKWTPQKDGRLTLEVHYLINFNLLKEI